jgi:type I restriction enzyme, S subunit
MVETPCIKRKSFAIGFRNLSIWNVAAQFAINWNWSEEVIMPLGAVLERRNEAALDALTPDTLITLLTIRFDGSIEPRNLIHIKDIKGKLFRVHANDVVFSKIDVRNGAIGLATDDIKNMCVTSEFPIYSVDAKKAYPEFIKLLFRTTAFKQLLNSMISGASGRKRIQPSQLENVKIPFPPLSIQQKIVVYWEKTIRHHSDLKKKEKNLLSVRP